VGHTKTDHRLGVPSVNNGTPYRTSPNLPKELIGVLPTIEQLEDGLKTDDGDFTIAES